MSSVKRAESCVWKFWREVGQAQSVKSTKFGRRSIFHDFVVVDLGIGVFEGLFD